MVAADGAVVAEGPPAWAFSGDGVGIDDVEDRCREAAALSPGARLGCVDAMMEIPAREEAAAFERMSVELREDRQARRACEERFDVGVEDDVRAFDVAREVAVCGRETLDRIWRDGDPIDDDFGDVVSSDILKGREDFIVVGDEGGEGIH